MDLRKELLEYLAQEAHCTPEEISVVSEDVLNGLLDAMKEGFGSLDLKDPRFGPEVQAYILMLSKLIIKQ